MAVNNSSNIRQIDTDSGSAIVTAAVPNWEIVGGTNVTTSASGNTITINASGTSQLVQQVRAQSTTSVSSTKFLTITSTPTTANSDLLISATITPTNSNNILLFEFNTPFSLNDAGIGAFFLFEGTTIRNSIIVGQDDPGRPMTANMIYYRTAGTTSSTTFHIYFNLFEASTIRTLQNSSGSALYGGNVATSFIITEIAV